MNDSIVPMPQDALLPESRSASENIEEALNLLRLAMQCLDAADEVTAPPHVQMAIDLLVSHDEDAPTAKTGVFRF